MTEIRIDWSQVANWATAYLVLGWVLRSVPDFMRAVIP